MLNKAAGLLQDAVNSSVCAGCSFSLRSPGIDSALSTSEDRSRCRQAAAVFGDPSQRRDGMSAEYEIARHSNTGTSVPIRI